MAIYIGENGDASYFIHAMKTRVDRDLFQYNQLCVSAGPGFLESMKMMNWLLWVEHPAESPRDNLIAAVNIRPGIALPIEDQE